MIVSMSSINKMNVYSLPVRKPTLNDILGEEKLGKQHHEFYSSILYFGNNALCNSEVEIISISFSDSKPSETVTCNHACISNIYTADADQNLPKFMH